MKRLYKNAFSVLALMLTCVLLAQSAFAANLKIQNVEVLGGSDTLAINSQGQQVNIYTNSVSITGKVYSPGAVPKVKIGNFEAAVSVSVSGDVYNFQVTGYKLNPGRNNVTIAASANNSSDRFSFSIYYYASPVPGASYTVQSLPTSGKIEAFNRTLSLTYPRNAILVDASGKPKDNVSITLSVYGNPMGAPESFTPAGQVFCISVSDFVYLSQQGQLTLPYNSGLSSVNADQLSVWYSPDPYWGDGDDINLGGITDTRRNTVTIPFQFRGKEGYYAVFLGQYLFKELEGNLGGVGYSHPCVMTLWAKGIAEPMTVGKNNKTCTYKNGYFGLVDDGNKEKDVTRLEFTTMLVKGLGIPLVDVSGSSVFSDVYPGFRADECYAGAYDGNTNQYNSNSTYYLPNVEAYIETAVRSGIIVGYPDDSGGLAFGPDKFLTREQAAVILARVANLKVSDDVAKAQEALKKIFKDGGSISPWAATSVLAAYNAKLIAGIPVGKDLEFQPTSYLTRAQAITLTYRLLKRLKKI